MDKKKLLISLLICFVAEGIGGLFTGQSVGTWYPALQKPFFTPPGWIFGPVWTILYLMMGVSFYSVWNKEPSGVQVRPALALFGVQLLLNVAWSAVFFGMQSILGGLMVIIALWSALALTMNRFRQISQFAAGMLLPYLAWVSFAAILNFTIWRLNP